MPLHEGRAPGQHSVSVPDGEAGRMRKQDSLSDRTDVTDLARNRSSRRKPWRRPSSASSSCLLAEPVRPPSSRPDGLIHVSCSISSSEGLLLGKASWDHTIVGVPATLCSSL